jgi:hypothetical protein
MTMTKGIVAAALLVAGMAAASAQTVREPYTTGSAGYTNGSGAYGGPAVAARSGRSLAPEFGYSNPKQGGIWSDPEEEGGSAERNLNGSTGGSSKHPSSEEFTR